MGMFSLPEFHRNTQESPSLHLQKLFGEPISIFFRLAHYTHVPPPKIPMQALK